MAQFKKMKKALALLMAVCMVSGVSACGEQQNVEENSPSVTEAPKDETTTKATTTAPKVTTTTTTTLPPLPVMEKYDTEEWYQKNNDMIGWIQIDGTPID